MPRNPKPGAPLGQRERDLAAQLPHSSTITEAGRKCGMSPQSADDAYAALKIKAPLRCAMLGIKRDRVLKRFDEWAENATKFQRFNELETKEVPDVRARIKANDCLAGIMGCYEDGTEAEGDRSPQIIINLGFVNSKRAEEILGKLTGGGADSGIALLSEGAIDVASGE